MKLSYYTTLDGADPLPKLGRLVHTRVEKPPLGPALAGKTTREGVFSDAKGRLFTSFPENERGWTEKPYFDEKSGSLNVHDSLYYGKCGDLTPDLSEAAINAVCVAISTGRRSAFPDAPSPRGLAVGESCSQEEVEDRRVIFQPWYCVQTDPSTHRITRVS